MKPLLDRLTALARLAAERAEVAAVIVVIGIVFMLILPLPIWLVDVLIALNICVSSVLVVLALYLPSPLAFSTFPAVLLVTTLFRLALEVSTTRLILLEADAGHIVEAFGQFVVGGNLVVGMVIFLILTVVQFLVITKGSERVAEVSARFTLDAMPGKQMSIDSDLRAGLIEAAEARRRRDDLGKESQLFGAMDGAMKFVKGDAIAGLIVVAVNLVGGIAIGVLQRGLPAGEAMKVYSVLTIGDGLIAQIPALLISLCAGLMITRVSQGGQKKDNVGQEITGQVLGEPRALVIASGVMVVFALVPGMPTVVFLVLALVTGSLGYFMLKAPKGPVEVVAAGPGGAVTVDAQIFKAAVPFQFALAPADFGDPRLGVLVDGARRRRNRLVEYFGMIVPAIDFIADPSMASGRYSFAVYEVPILAGPLRWQQVRAQASLEQLTALGLDGEEDALARPGCWVAADAAARLDEAGVVHQPFHEVLAAALEDILRRNASKFIGLHEAQLVLNWTESKMPLLAKEIERVLPTARIAEVLQRLVAEQVPIRNLRQIVETLFDWGQRERDPGMLADFVRIALKRQLCHEFAPGNVLRALMLSPGTEEMLRNAVRQTAHGSFLALTGEQSRTLLDRLRSQMGEPAEGEGPPVLLVAQDLRRCVRKLVEDELFGLPVLSYAELVSEIQIQPLGRV
ncbi:type III secretion system export apparatus subunit SctV [Chitinimonas koreensis]|uniref:type III secretion system export apparatus subunit SctV n=1 Tax=Chitinimonas koreensis TaxID=356302 RepID=UPI000418124F|nr:type III secretion system export apparatus subunit SctV [Chitinimonas koreensis]QNM97628.1 type III secretion system export apparatus subunit SctV [Chitinimonas koreensis]